MADAIEVDGDVNPNPNNDEVRLSSIKRWLLLEHEESRCSAIEVVLALGVARDHVKLKDEPQS